MSWRAISNRELRLLGASNSGFVAPARRLRSSIPLQPDPVIPFVLPNTVDLVAPEKPRSPRWASPESESSIEALESFSIFCKLPKSVRKQIWTMAIPSRVVVLHYDTKNSNFVTEEPNIALLSVSKEARKAALKLVLPAFSANYSSRVIYIDVEQDKFFLDPGRYGDLGRMLIQWHGTLIPQHSRRIERLDIGLYENRNQSAMNCVKTLGETFLLDQATLGLPFTQVRLLAHTPFRCNFERHTSRMFTVDCEDQATIAWEEDLAAKIKEVNDSMLEITGDPT
ncbi:hypothetical protein DL95DRAFT_412091 [Leptodontidium sp. 2 PMI_412]|nr:hypothetical protein DL95DRAFT_412091 [Leptodontidium sp. 2 PMI_412]